MTHFRGHIIPLITIHEPPSMATWGLQLSSQTEGKSSEVRDRLCCQSETGQCNIQAAFSDNAGILCTTPTLTQRNAGTPLTYARSQRREYVKTHSVEGQVSGGNASLIGVN